MTGRALLVPTLWGDFQAGLERTLSAIARGLLDRDYSVDVAVRQPIDLDLVQHLYGVDLTGLRVRLVPNWSVPWKKVAMIGATLGNQAARRGFKRLTAEYQFVLVQSSYVPLTSKATRSVLFNEFPRDPRPQSIDWRSRVDSYDAIFGNSDFTSGWIKRYWGVDCSVLYPSVQECRPLEKTRAILGVGRFHRGGRDKGQIGMVRIFRDLVDAGLDDCRLWLAGLESSAGYLAEVRARAEGYPIDIFVSPSATELAELYGRATLFWHTVGLGVDQELAPQELEHFGIVVAEAMTAGCVPLVFRGGGPPEIVGQPELCFEDLDEMARKTVSLLNEPQRVAVLSHQCRTSAVGRFGHQAFDRSIDRLIGTTGT